MSLFLTSVIRLYNDGLTLGIVIKVKHINIKLNIIDVTIISIPKKISLAK